MGLMLKQDKTSTTNMSWLRKN